MSAIPRLFVWKYAPGHLRSIVCRWLGSQHLSGYRPNNFYGDGNDRERRNHFRFLNRPSNQVASSRTCLLEDIPLRTRLRELD